ncbi:universal stress protein [Streptomyces montanus]|uniref:Universal stress protein n=1 Tax=Streptomyces montanus TaxID=2580423 RepID=A0A5R9FX88_9ACTN|nr:universal stress protein [Streptomyces montanus]TLS48091.1 universal stress protein [Streptomyces montanus]
MQPPVVAGVDGSPESLAAAEWAAREAVRRGLPLRLVHATNWNPAPVPSAAASTVRRSPEGRGILREAEDRIARTCPGARLTDEQLEGPATAALLRAAEHSALMVLGSRGLSGFTGFLVGSVALGVVARAARPVVLVRAGEEAADEHAADVDGQASVGTPYRDVVLGIDLSDASDEVIGFAFDAARQRKAGLHVVHVWSAPSPLTLGPGEIGLVEGPGRVAEWRGFLSAVLETWRGKFPDVEVTETLVEGRAGTHLVRASTGAGLLVLGRRAHESPLGPRTGPVAHTVIRHASCPVAIVPHG